MQKEDEPEFPFALVHLWNWFNELMAGSGEGIRWRDLQAWSEMTGNQPEPWETAALMRLSSTYAAIVAEERRKQQTSK